MKSDNRAARFNESSGLRQSAESRYKPPGEGERPPPSSERLSVLSFLTFSASVCSTATWRWCPAKMMSLPVVVPLPVNASCFC